MANTIKLKQSSVAAKVPTTAALALGELAINTTDGLLYLKKNVSGTESIVTVNPALTSSAVTTALGYTPYNSTNPSGYITRDIATGIRSNATAVAASQIDCNVGNFFTKTATGALTWTVANVPAGRVFSFLLELTNGGTGTQTWFTGIKWPGGTAPTLTAAGVDLLGFVTDDGGTTWRGVLLMKDSK